MKKKIVLFDIDYTLFNARSYRDNLWVELGKVIDPSNIDGIVVEAEKAYLSLRETLSFFGPFEYVSVLEKRLKRTLDGKLIAQKAQEFAESGQSLYDEVLPLLDEFKKRNIEMGIFSTGLSTFQEGKISSIRHFFKDEHIYIHENKKFILPDVIEKYKSHTLFLVDDFFQLLEEAKKINPNMYAIWIKRGRHAEKLTYDEKSLVDAVIQNLSELLPIIDKYNID